MNNLTPAQAQQQNNRNPDGTYKGKACAETDLDLAHTDIVQAQADARFAEDHDGCTKVEFYHTENPVEFSEFGEYTPIAGGENEMGYVGSFSVRRPDGTIVEVMEKVSVSQDEEDGMWWQVHEARQTVYTEDWHYRGEHELRAGNVSGQRFETQEEALQDLRGSIGDHTFDDMWSNGDFDKVDGLWSNSDPED